MDGMVRLTRVDLAVCQLLGLQPGEMLDFPGRSGFDHLSSVR